MCFPYAQASDLSADEGWVMAATMMKIALYQKRYKAIFLDTEATGSAGGGIP